MIERLIEYCARNRAVVIAAWIVFALYGTWVMFRMPVDNEMGIGRHRVETDRMLFHLGLDIGHVGLQETCQVLLVMR